MFHTDAKNPLQIRELMTQFGEDYSAGGKSTLQLLESTAIFLSKTEPLFKKRRGVLKDPIIKQILQDLSDGFKKFETAVPQNQRSAEIINAYSTSVGAVKVRLHEMEQNKDPIFGYYQKHHNILKSVLASEHRPNNRK